MVHGALSVHGPWPMVHCLSMVLGLLLGYSTAALGWVTPHHPKTDFLDQEIGIHGVQRVHGIHGLPTSHPSNQPASQHLWARAESFVGPGIGVGVGSGREGSQHLEAKREVFWGEVLGSV